jgi:aryl-alcohol dehydrogenase-like predicted oxidoreductase
VEVFGAILGARIVLFSSQFDAQAWNAHSRIRNSSHGDSPAAEHFPRNVAAVEELKRLATKYGKSLPQFALRWTLSNPVVGTALVGFRPPAEVTENLGALGWEISNVDLAEVDAILDRHGAVTVPPGWLED